MVNGTITVPAADGPIQWATPDCWVFSSGLAGHGIYGPAFKIVDMVNAGSNNIITTNLTTTGSVPSGVRTSCAPQLTFVNCVGSEEAISWSNCEPLKPIHSRWNRTYTTNIGQPNILAALTGKVTKVQFIVNSVFGAGLFRYLIGGFSGAFVAQMSDNTVLTMDAAIDLTHAGTRTISYRQDTNDYIYSGAQGSDSFAMPGTGAMWLFADQLYPAMSGVSGTLGSITFIMELDQGITFPIGSIPPQLMGQACL
jgi:hypothetical protein